MTTNYVNRIRSQLSKH